MSSFGCGSLSGGAICWPQAGNVHSRGKVKGGCRVKTEMKGSDEKSFRLSEDTALGRHTVKGLCLCSNSQLIVIPSCRSQTERC